ncbi:MAG: DUF6460 domain-containing protein [Alphaproteobacteria bacterium]|jgi:hypothetical protein|uniref:DUF6460 domain-containing protein n=1 Tax=Pacificispira sp. TaxID=2888761 RepID=UPI001B0A7152|nr:integrase [Alphaproteobacteria bacterium]MBO6863884.1 integrase [Alphaproteobacteria bacterium]MEC9266763.1 DUF6460 domain-containing protein [Pseudomonadota bacterium]
MRTDLSKVMATLLKLAVISFVVGWLLVQFDITPETIFDNFGETVRKIYDFARGAIEWSAGYIVIGAVIVIPIWLISVVLGMLKGRRRSE